MHSAVSLKIQQILDAIQKLAVLYGDYLKLQSFTRKQETFFII